MNIFKLITPALLFVSLHRPTYAGVMIDGGELLNDWIAEKDEDDGNFYMLMPPNPNATDDKEMFVGSRRSGQATMTHSCNTIRGVPSQLRTARGIGPRGLGRFYQKYTEAYGIPVLGSSRASDSSLKRACYVIRFLLAGHSGVRQSFYSLSGRVAVIGVNEQTTDIPEHSWLGSWWNTRARGLGATPSAPVSTAGEENFLCLTRDRYRSQDIGLHEYSHAVHLLGSKYAIRGWDRKLAQLYSSHRRSGKWARTYSMSTKQELFAEGTQSYFNVNSYSPQPDGVRGPVSTRDKLRNYDPLLYGLIKQVFPCDNQFIKRCEKNRAREMKQVLKMNCDKGTPVTSRPVFTGKTGKPVITVGPRVSTTTEPIIVPPTPGSCNDRNRHCSGWSRRGYCRSYYYGRWMKTFCKKSCRVCV